MADGSSDQSAPGQWLPPFGPEHLCFSLMCEGMNTTIYSTLCVQLSVALREEHMLRVLENRVLRGRR
jgi:hypothetical protein